MQERTGEPASGMLIKCVPDQDGCIELASVLRIMSQIDQEQAWALAYQLAALMQRLWPAGNNCATIETLAQIYINQEGWVHEKSLEVGAERPVSRRRSRSELSSPITSDEADDESAMQHTSDDSTIPQSAAHRNSSHSSSSSNNNNNNNNNAEPTSARLTTQSATSRHAKLPPTPPITPELHEERRRRRASSEQELVSSLGIALFEALDYGIPEDEERKLSRAMEFLIVQSQKGLTLAELEAICVERLPAKSRLAAEQHYREVCKALIADTIELSILLDKIYTATMVMNGAGPAAVVAAANGLQAPSQPTSASTPNTNGANKPSDKLAHHGDTNYLHLGERQATQADYLHQHFLHTIDQDELGDLGLPLASLRALKINEWARLWMQVIRELRQKRRFQQHQQRHQYENEHAPNDVLQAV